MIDFLAKHKVKLIKLLVASLLLLSLTVYIIFSINKNKSIYISRPPYDKSGFVESKSYNDDHVFKIANSRFEFNINAKDTKFSVKDNMTLQTWNSNPEQVSASYPIELNELFVVYYERQLETPKPISVYDESIKDKDFAFKVGAQSIDVLYMIGRDEEKSFIDLPRKIPAEKFNKLIIEPLRQLADTDSQVAEYLGFIENQYMVVDEGDARFLGNVKSTKVIQVLYELIMVKSLYTYEDYVEDSAKYGFPTEVEEPYFEFIVRYEITNKGLSVTLFNDSIVESEKYQLAYIDVLPYFGANNINEDGITVIPDGSGILINHNNGKYNNPIYDKRIYGSDRSIGNQMDVMPEEQETIKLPMYGYTKNDHGFINVLEKSDSMASLRAGFRTTSSSGVYVNVVPFAHFRYIIRERDAFIFSSSVSSQRVSMWTKEYNKEDYQSTYIFGQETKTYYDIAKLYQNHLVDTYNLKEITSEKKMHLTMLGGYKELKYFVGFPYNSVQTLTNAKEIEAILSEINYGPNQLDVSYQGWSNGGIKPTSMHKIKYNNSISSKKDILKTETALKEKSVDLYFEFNTQSAYTKESIHVGNDVVKNLFQKPVVYYKYNQATMLADKTTMGSYRLNLAAQTKVYNRINKLSYKNIVLTDEAQSLASDFSKNNVAFRDEVIRNFNQNIDRLDKSIIFRSPNLYGLLKADKVLDMPISGTRNRMSDYEIPFIHLVFNGYLDYSNPSFNLDTSKSIMWHKLKAIETGGRVQFTLSYKDTFNLIKTEYSQYYSTYYNNWIHDINYILDELNEIDIYHAKIVSHKTLNLQGTIVEVIYSNSKKFVINYETNTVVESNVII